MTVVFLMPNGYKLRLERKTMSKEVMLYRDKQRLFALFIDEL